MKTINKLTAVINLLIFIGTTTLGFCSGMLTGNYRSGLLFGIAVGILGITGFRYYMERRLRSISMQVPKTSLRKETNK